MFVRGWRDRGVEWMESAGKGRRTAAATARVQRYRKPRESMRVGSCMACSSI